MIAAEVPADEPFVLEGEIDVEEMLAASTFPIKPDALILKAKKFLASDFGVKDPDAVSEDFRFVAPVVGPLDKKTFLEAFGSFKIKEAFPDFNVQYHDFRVDPFEPNRVWLTVRGRGTNTGKFANSIPATNKVSPTEFTQLWSAHQQFVNCFLPWSARMQVQTVAFPPPYDLRGSHQPSAGGLRHLQRAGIGD
eukprot:1189727-Prorocentrum_minimum.AAC.3